jgi:hypothetical protein
MPKMPDLPKIEKRRVGLPYEMSCEIPSVSPLSKGRTCARFLPFVNRETSVSFPPLEKGE